MGPGGGSGGGRGRGRWVSGPPLAAGGGAREGVQAGSQGLMGPYPLPLIRLLSRPHPCVFYQTIEFLIYSFRYISFAIYAYIIKYTCYHIYMYTDIYVLKVLYHKCIVDSRACVPIPVLDRFILVL